MHRISAYMYKIYLLLIGVASNSNIFSVPKITVKECERNEMVRQIIIYRFDGV